MVNNFPSQNTVASPINSEYSGISNVKGTIAMALVSGNVNSATNQFFFNTVDNNSATAPANLDAEGFTVFGKVANASSLNVLEEINSLPTFNASGLFTTSSDSSWAGDFTDLPLFDYDSTVGLLVQNFVIVSSVTQVTLQDFPTWQTAKFLPAQQSNASFIAPSSTPFKDGVPNLLKYLYDIDPSQPMSSHDQSMLPKAGTLSSGGTTYLTLTYRRNVEATGMTVNVQTSPDLKTWTTVTAPTVVKTGTDTTTGNTDPILQVQVAVTGAEQFIRLNVSQP